LPEEPAVAFGCSRPETLIVASVSLSRFPVIALRYVIVVLRFSFSSSVFFSKQGQLLFHNFAAVNVE
jgi:hypothetical protein